MSPQFSRPSALFLVLLTLVVASACRSSAPAGPPSTDVWIADLIETGGMIGVGAPTNLTDRADYDNQPAFVSDGASLLYTSRRGEQTDIYRIDLVTGRSAVAVVTLESEYSPTPTPDGNGYSVVRVERDGRQRLWRFPAGDGAPTLILREIEPVGYHAWLDPRTVALYVLGSPATLWIADPTDGRARQVREGIGRSLQVRPGGGVLGYVDRGADDGSQGWWIRLLDVESGEDRALVRALPGSEDFAWTPGGRLLQGRDGALFAFTPDVDQEWQPLADWHDRGVRAITRIAVAPDGDRLAFVAEVGDRDTDR